MSSWWRKAQDRAFNLGLSVGELTRRVHGAVERRDMVQLALALEETRQRQDAELAARQRKLFGKGRAV